MYDSLIYYFEHQLKVTTNDLLATDKERYTLIGKLELLEAIKIINDRGFPQQEEVDNETK